MGDKVVKFLEQRYAAVVTKMARLCCVLVTLMVLHGVACQTIYKICVDKSTSGSNECDALKKTDSEVNCIVTIDSVDCANKIKNGEADFAVFTPDEIALASKSINDDAYVIFEIREQAILSHKFHTVVVVKNTYNDGLEGLKNKNYCHPGFEDSQWGEQALKFFESQVVEPVCNKDMTTIEEELNSITRHFSKICRPWASDIDFAKQYETKYQSLCSLCNDRGSCNYNLGQGKTHEAALNCLTSGGGDLAYVGYQESKEYFQNKGGSSDYKYLCIDGRTTENINVPCYWYNQTWNAIVASKKAATELQNKIERWLLTPRSSVSWQKALYEIMKFSPFNKQLKKLSDYIAQGNAQISNAQKECTRDPIRWCTTSTVEQKKCQVLKQASSITLIKPDINCVESTSDWECFKKLEDGDADVMGINTNLGFFTKKRFNFKSIFYQDPADNTHFYISVPVVRADSGINSYSSLKDKNACFPEFGGLTFISFLDVLRSQSIQPDACLYGNTMGSFFKNTCSPGAVDDNRDPEKLNKDDVLCSLCPRKDAEDKCVAESTSNSFYGDVGAMRCLTTNDGDVAFINANSLPDIRAAGIFNVVNEDQYRFLCINGSQIPLTNTGDIHACAIAVLLGGEVVARNMLSVTQSSDIRFALLKMDSTFGYNTRMFRMYEVFEGTEKLLFKSKAIGLLQEIDASQDYINSYINLIGRSDECSSGVLLEASRTTLVLTLVASGISLLFTRK